MASPLHSSFSSNASSNDSDKAGPLRITTSRSARSEKHEPAKHAHTLPPSPLSSRADSAPGHDDEYKQDADCTTVETHAHAVDQAYEAIWRSFCGLPPQEARPSFYLGGQESFESLHERLAHQEGLLEHFECEVRKDWDSGTGELTLRLMTTPLHDAFKDLFVIALDRGLERLATEYPLLAPFRAKILSGGHGYVRKQSGSRAPYFDKSPDGQLAYQKEKYPPFLFEVAYSQPDHDLRTTCAGYLEEIPGCTVIGFDIGYHGSERRREPGHYHSASLAMWTSSIADDTDDTDDIIIRPLLKETVFRNNKGQALPGELSIPFRLLCPSRERPLIPEAVQDVALRMDFAQLAGFVGAAEERQRDAEAAAESRSSAVPRRRKIRWLDDEGNTTKERDVAEPKRRRVGSDAEVAERRTRSTSRPRRSSRLSSVSSNRDSQG
ncbi:hypothetical protein GGR56DRAFT_150516 [Xylariaceae sp. FL0804]|nr:hypothetical protein GGR56DRAFT_150516 [Xylariaceae sp. FL0804]